ncbi:M1 family aminopeptidase [Pseudonocardia sp.]|uniref:M1 family aminopeptidase n=1 Tax=Pseudonocardia sp. TaxID=60912 RepID=UPI0026374A8A|nr:M1 family aminopeptidase [Pseudonocardia sp.]
MIGTVHCSPPRRRVSAALAALTVATLVAGCTSGGGRAGGISGGGGAEGGPSDGEVGRAQPWEQRPVVGLQFDVAADLASVTGRETVLFTPDAPVCELVFRMWDNKPTAAQDGTSMELGEVTVDGRPVVADVVPAGAPDGVPGTLAEVPLPACVDAGTQVRAELGFSVELGEDSGERVGHAPDEELAWFATAFPLLAWVRGEGWARDPAVDMYGETVTSEDFRLDALEVTAPREYAVLGSGSPAGTEAGSSPGTTTHRFTAEALRDVSVSVGRFVVQERRVGDVALRVGTPESGSRVDGEEWTDELAYALRELEELFGPYPYPDLWASVLPPLADGVEFPSALQFGDVRRSTVSALVAHELAHMWFYSLVGNNQARDPWIDESFATYGQVLVTGREDAYRLDDVGRRVRGELGQPMEYWAEAGGFGRYVRGTYDQGAAVLLEARDRAGAERFDAAVRDYLATRAHQVVDPSEVRASFESVPELIDLLGDAGAFG